MRPDARPEPNQRASAVSVLQCVDGEFVEFMARAAVTRPDVIIRAGSTVVGRRKLSRTVYCRTCWHGMGGPSRQIDHSDYGGKKSVRKTDLHSVMQKDYSRPKHLVAPVSTCEWGNYWGNEMHPH